MFTPRSFVEIVGGMIRHMKATQKSVTDFHVGSVARTLVEAPAIEMDEMYQEMAQGVTDAIPVALYNAFDFAALPATAAGGVVRITAAQMVDDPVIIPAGTILKRTSPTLEYRTLADATIPHGGTYVDVSVVAQLTGALGNAPAGLLFSQTINSPSKITAQNPDRLYGGTEAESDADRAARFIEYVGSLSRGTIGAVRYAISQSVVKTGDIVTETVTRIGLVENPGHVLFYIQGSHGAPSAALLAAAQLSVDGTDELPGYRPAGVRVDVLPTTQYSVDVAFKVRMFDGVGNSTTLSAIQTAVSALLETILPGDVLYVDALIDAALAVTGVERVVCENSANLTCPHHNVLIMGNVTAEWVNA